MTNTPSTTKIIIGIVVALLIIVGFYLDFRPEQDSMNMDDKDKSGMDTQPAGTANGQATPTAPAASGQTVVQGGNTVTTTKTTVTTGPNWLRGSEWVWQYTTFMDKSKIAAPNGGRFVLKFGTDGRMVSTTDCNSLSAPYFINKDALTFGPLVATQKACAGNTSEAEYSKELGQVTGFATTSNELRLTLGKNAGSMIFLKKTIHN